MSEDWEHGDSQLCKHRIGTDLMQVLEILVTGHSLEAHNMKWSLKKTQRGLNLNSEVSACRDTVGSPPKQPQRLIAICYRLNMVILPPNNR